MIFCLFTSTLVPNSKRSLFCLPPDKYNILLPFSAKVKNIISACSVPQHCITSCHLLSTTPQCSVQLFRNTATKISWKQLSHSQRTNFSPPRAHIIPFVQNYKKITLLQYISHAETHNVHVQKVIPVNSGVVWYCSSTKNKLHSL